MRSLLINLITAALLTLAPHDSRAATLRNATLQVVRTNTSQIAISWQAKSAVPVPGLQIVPNYQLEKCSDLTNWTSFGLLRTGVANNQTLQTLDTFSNGTSLYRVKSIVDQIGRAHV